MRLNNMRPHIVGYMRKSDWVLLTDQISLSDWSICVLQCVLTYLFNQAVLRHDQKVKTKT